MFSKDLKRLLRYKVNKRQTLIQTIREVKTSKNKSRKKGYHARDSTKGQEQISLNSVKFSNLFRLVIDSCSPKR